MNKIITTFLLLFSYGLFSQSGNSCDQSIEITAGDYFIDNISESVDSNITNCTELNGNPENLKWYSYTTIQNLYVTVNSNLESNPPPDDTRLHIYEGSCDNLICVAGNDDIGESGLYNGFLSSATFEAIAGNTYYIVWDNYWSNSNFNFQVIESEEAPTSVYTNFNHENLDREYIYYEPDGLENNSPLVFVMHGYSSDAENIRNYSDMNNIADEYGFAVCYPRGTIDDYGNRFWNVGYDFHPNETVDDISFLKELAGYLQQTHNLSEANTFAAGMSNGGEMCYMLACEASDVFKAVVSVAGMMLQEIMDTCNPENLIPIFEIHGTSDNVNFYNGDPNSSGGWGAYPSIPETIDYWSDLNNCTSFSTEDLPNTNNNDGSYVVKERHYDSDNGNEIWLYRVVGGGHDWPGGYGNMDIDSALEAWLFFELSMNNSLSNNTLLIDNFIISPNPVKEKIIIQSALSDYTYSLYDLNGKKIMEDKNPVIDFTNKAKGTYLLKIYSENTTITKKIIKQ